MLPLYMILLIVLFVFRCRIFVCRLPRSPSNGKLADHRLPRLSTCRMIQEQSFRLHSRHMSGMSQTTLLMTLAKEVMARQQSARTQQESVDWA
jgi:hypothetical protein